MDKDKYLEYLRIHHDRLSSKAQRDGITRWALIGAAIYLIFKLVEVSVHIRNDLTLIKFVIFVYCHFHVATLLLGIVFNTGGSKRTRSFDYRFFAQHQTHDFQPALLALFLLIVVPSIACVVFLSSALSAGQKFVLVTNAVFGIAIFLILVIFVINALRTVIKTGLPYYSVLASNEARFFKYISFIMEIFLITGALINTYWLIQVSRNIPESGFTDVVVMGICLSLLSFVIIYYINSFAEEKSLHLIERFERDILFCDLSEKEIKQRLEEEFIGQEIGSSLRDKLIQVRENADELIKELNNAENLLTELDALDVNLKFERQGRLEEYLKDIKRMQHSYKNNIEVLMDWLSNTVSYEKFFFDKYVQDLLKETVEKIKDINNEVSQKTTDTLSLLEKRISLLKKELETDNT